jgi:hypothetical protein
VGTSGNDTISGTSGIGIIAGLGGDDSITELGKDDIVCGGDGNDTLISGADTDKCVGATMPPSGIPSKDAGGSRLRLPATLRAVLTVTGPRLRPVCISRRGDRNRVISGL